MSDELTLYQTDRAAWIADTAPITARKLVTWGEDVMRRAWPLIGDDYKAAIWMQLDRAGRILLRKALDGKATELEKVPA